MVRVKSFLGCINIEKGGIFLGWFFFTIFFALTGAIFAYGIRVFYEKRELKIDVEIRGSFDDFSYSSSPAYVDLAGHHHLLDHH
jgi:hypothetical protein